MGRLTATTNGKLGSASPRSNVSDVSNVSNVSTVGTKRPAEDNPASPTLSSRPGSIRRLFSRNLLNNAYANGEEEGGSDSRPPTRGSSAMDSKKAKRSSGWFSRLRSVDTAASNKRLSTPLTSPTEEKKMGPPPPMIPELSELKSKLGTQDEAGFGSDLFKNIK
jgi:hypothetical protein